MSKPVCLLFLNRDHRLNSIVIQAVEKFLTIKKIFYQKDPDLNENELRDLNPNFIINFLCDRVHRGPILRYPNINFHPGTPEYPGRGGASFVLFDGKKDYGATSHIMIERVDQGPIFDVALFEISENERCDQVFDRAEDASFELLKRSLPHLAENKLPPIRKDLHWTGKAVSRKQFQKWLILDPSNKDEFLKKIKASKHRLFSGPYIMVHGEKFALVHDVK